LDEALSQDVAHIDDLLFLGDAQTALGILSSYVTRQPSYLTWTILPSLFLSLLVGFNKKIMQICGNMMVLRSWEFFQGPLARHQA
jgi:hypothetical protein